MILGWLTLLQTLGKMRGAGGMPAGVFFFLETRLRRIWAPARLIGELVLSYFLAYLFDLFSECSTGFSGTFWSVSLPF